MKDRRLKPAPTEMPASVPEEPSVPKELAELDESWDEDQISLELDDADNMFHRPTAVPTVPPERLAQQMMRSLEGPRPSEEASGPRASPRLELDPDPAASTALELADNNAPPELRRPSKAGQELGLTSSLPSSSDSQAARQDMKDRYATGDFTGSLAIAETILKDSPEDKDALKYANSCREVLTDMYTARLGSLTQRVTVAIPGNEIRWLSLDHRAGFLLSLVDGQLTIEEILDVSGMPRLDALRIVYTLLEQRVISLLQHA